MIIRLDMDQVECLLRLLKYGTISAAEHRELIEVLQQLEEYKKYKEGYPDVSL